MKAIAVTPRDSGYGYVVEYSDGSTYINGNDVAVPTLDELNTPKVPSKRVAPGRYEVASPMGTFTVYSYEQDPAGGYGAGIMWQLLLDGEWPGTDPFYTKREALEGVAAFLRSERM